jgi:hypothetical protein
MLRGNMIPPLKRPAQQIAEQAMEALVGASAPVRYQENALDLDEAGDEHRAKFIIGAQLRYLGPSDENPPAGLEPGDLVTVAERHEGLRQLGIEGGHGIAVVGPRGGVDMVWWYEVELVEDNADPR